MHTKKGNSFLSRNIITILTLIFFVSIASGCVAIYYYYNTFGGVISSDHVRWGTMGDFFGGVLNPIFSLLALLALLLTIILQNRELVLSQKEFSKSAKALAEQSESIRKQNFENTFFRLINLHNDIIDSLEYLGKKKRQCFLKYIGMLELNGEVSEETKEKRRRANISDTYNKNYDKIAESVEHYHKNLYQIISFVDKYGPDNNRKLYINFIRSQLSRHELHLLFLHGLSRYGQDKFKPLIEKYEILEHLPKETFLLKENIRLYERSAFGKNYELLDIYNNKE